MKNKITIYIIVLFAAVAGGLTGFAQSGGTSKEQPQSKPKAYLIVEEYSQTLNGPEKKAEIGRLGLEIGREGYTGTTLWRTFWQKTTATKNVNGATVTEVRNEPIKVAFGTEAWATLVTADTVTVTLKRQTLDGVEISPDGASSTPLVNEKKFTTTLVFKAGQPITAGASGFGRLVFRLVPML